MLYFQCEGTHFIAEGGQGGIVYLTTVYQYQMARAKYQARVDDLRAPEDSKGISCGKSGLKQEIHFINKREFM